MYLSIIGTRPQYVKLAQIDYYCKSQGINHSYIDTGQHFDPRLSSELIDALGLSPALSAFSIGGRPAHEQVSYLVKPLYEELRSLTKDIASVLVYGDTNSTLGATIVSKMLELRVCHIEAGVRSNLRGQPEEINRRMVDTNSDLLFAPTETAMSHLRKEHLDFKAHLTGDLSVDVVTNWRKRYGHRQNTGRERGYLLLTLHRPHNVDNFVILKNIFDCLARTPFDFLLPKHPRLGKRLEEFSINIPKNVEIIEPQLQDSMLSLLEESGGLVTDSGGLQKEAFLLQKIVTTIGHTTEWIETLQNGWNILWNPIDKSLESFVDAISRSTPKNYDSTWLGSGCIAERMFDILRRWD